ncbi:MAG: hypothetical protein E5W39_03285 [Mesorhizobium sp.]|nr:MAG: hypothetical protein E5W39_03285 [Mesorhizobium sp.]
MTVAGKKPFFYYIKPETGPIVIGMALGNDPFFVNDTEHFVLDIMLGEEEIAEKFEALQVGNELILFYESRLEDKSWRTGLRRYKIL